MKKYIPLVIVIFSVILACALPTPAPTATPIPTATPTDTATPIPTPTPTATPTPLPTPTPIPSVRIANGDHALFLGDWDTALTAYQEAYNASSEPETQAAAQMGMGRAQYEKGEYAQALNTFRDLVDRFQSSAYRADAYFFLGLTYEALDRWGDAAEAYLNYMALRPAVIDAYVLERRGDALTAAGNYAAALMDYQAAVQSVRLYGDLSLEVKLARTNSILGDYGTALVMYQDIYQRTGSDYVKAQVDYLMGQAYAAAGQIEQAQTAYLDGVSNYPRFYDSYLGLIELVNSGYTVDELQRGKVDYYAGEYGVAEAALDRYLQNSPADAGTAYYFKGLLYRALGDYASAVSQWEAVIQDYPSSDVWDDSWEEKAYTQWAYMDQYPEGQKTLEDFVTAAPAHSRAAEFLFDAGRVAERDNRLEEAAHLWERIPSEYPTSDYVYRANFLAGISYYRLARYVSAQTVFQRAQEISTDITQRAGSLFWLAKTQAAQGETVTAQANWQQAAAIDPTGYYSERAADILVGRAPFTQPAVIDLTFDRRSERTEAEAWLRTKFNLPAETDLAGPGNLASDPRYIRGQELWRLGRYEAARIEFEDLRSAVQPEAADTYRLMNAFYDLGLYRSAVLASRQVLTLAGMDDAATLSAPAYFNHIRFGTYYADLVVPAAQSNSFSPLLVWSLMRQESFYEGFIYSPAGARGLMQIMPATGEAAATQDGWPPNFTADDLYRPLVSVNLGVSYLRKQLEGLNGDLYAAMAAYNGGPGNAAAWKEAAGTDPDLFVEVIRYDETRRYLTNIYEIFSIYRRLYDRTP